MEVIKGFDKIINLLKEEVYQLTGISFLDYKILNLIHGYIC